MFNEDMLLGKRVLITGGGSGLGRSIGKRVVELGARLTICGRTVEKLQHAADEFDAIGKNNSNYSVRYSRA